MTDREVFDTPEEAIAAALADGLVEEVPGTDPPELRVTVKGQIALAQEAVN